MGKTCGPWEIKGSHGRYKGVLRKGRKLVGKEIGVGHGKSRAHMDWFLRGKLVGKGFISEERELVGKKFWVFVCWVIMGCCRVGIRVCLGL